MKPIIEEKQALSNELAAELKKAKSFLIFEYLGLNAKELTSLRRKLHDAGAQMFVAKNNIFNRAISSNGFPGFDEVTGPCAIVVANGDEVAPFKIVNDLIKDKTFIKYRDGLLESNHIAPAKLAQVAAIPGRNELYSMLLSCLQGSVRNLLYGLKAVSDTKQ